MRLIKSPMRSSTGRFGSRYAGNSPPACAESVGTWNSAALTAVTINKNAFFVSTPHLPLPTRANLLVFRCLRSEEHTSELQSPCNLVCRLLLEKKKNHKKSSNYHTHSTELPRP